MNLSLQQNPEQNATVVLENFIRLLNIRVSKKSLEQVRYYPYFPSLESLSMALSEWGVESLILKLELNRLKDIDFPAIGHFKTERGKFVILTKIDGNEIVYHDPEFGWRKQTLHEFSSYWSGIVLVTELTSPLGDPNYSVDEKEELLKGWRNRAILAISTLIVLLSLFSAESFPELCLGILYVCGIVITGLIVSSEIGFVSNSKICALSEKVDCNSVLTSPAATLFGIVKMSDIGLVWFSGNWLMWWLCNIHLPTDQGIAGVGVLALFSLMYVPFSILYQGLKIKRWCVLCLGVQVILILVFLMTYSYLTKLPKFLAAINVHFYFTIGFIVPFLLWLWIKPMLLSVQKLADLESQLLSFTKDTEIFNFLLQSTSVVTVPDLPLKVQMGSLLANTKILIIANTHCNACSKTFNKLKPLIERIGDKISIEIFFLSKQNVDYSNGLVSQHLISLPHDRQFDAIFHWFEEKNYESLLDRFPVDINENAQHILTKHIEWCNLNHVAATPKVFLNGNLISEKFSISDVIYQLWHFVTKRETY